MCLAALAWAYPAAAGDVFRGFASCAGRYSAEVEHAWLMQDPAAEQHEERRAAFLSMLEALDPVRTGPEALNHRVAAKAAHAGLLGQAAFAPDPVHRTVARRLAQSHQAACAGLLLGG